MILSDIQQKIYTETNTDSTSYPNAKMLVDLNIWQSYITAMITDSQDESDFDDINHGDYPIVTTPLSVNRDYLIPQSEKVINIKTVNVSYDGVNWYRARPVDDGELNLSFPPSSATTANSTLDNYFSVNDPRYDVKYNAVFLYPKPTQVHVDAGGQIQIEWTREAKELTSSDLTTGTMTPGFDLAFQPMMAYGPAYEYFCSKKMFDSADRVKAKLDELELRLRRQYGSKQKDRVMALTANDEINLGYK